jgi:hypothetical protein
MALAGRAVLAETSPFGPALVHDSTGKTGTGLLVGWTADDAARTVNLAGWGGATTLFNRTTVGSPATPTSGPSLRVAQDNLYVMFRAENPAFAYFAAFPSTAANTGIRVASPIGAEAAGPHFAYFDAAGKLVIDG